MPRRILTPEERAAKAAALRAYQKAWKEANRDKVRANARAYSDRHRESERTRLAAYREANRETLREKAREYYENNKDQHAAAVKRWQEANPEQAAARHRRWTERNPDGARMKTHRFRANHPERIKKYADEHKPEACAKQKVRLKRIKSSSSHYTHGDWIYILEFQGYKCIYCSIDIRNDNEVDHWMPIARGGSNARENIQGCCGDCNRSKASRHPLEYEASIGFVRTYPVGAAFAMASPQREASPQHQPP